MCAVQTPPPAALNPPHRDEAKALQCEQERKLQVTEKPTTPCNFKNAMVGGLTPRRTHVLPRACGKAPQSRA